MTTWNIAVGVWLGIGLHEFVKDLTRVLILKIKEQR